MMVPLYSLYKSSSPWSALAVEFAGIQCQVHFEDFQEEKHKPGFIENLNEFLPAMYASSWGIEKKVLKAYRKHQGLSQLEAKNLYIKTARDLPTYGVTFFLVKEKQHNKKKLVPRLLGINAQAILRMDENTKEILQQWPLTQVKSYHVGKSETFTLDFGDYSDKEYCCKTQDVLRIRDILEGYIDLIRRRMFGAPSGDAAESLAVCVDHVGAGQSSIIQHVQNQASKPISETFVGPSRIISYDKGSTPQQGTIMMTTRQVIASNQFNNPQKALKGEVALRGDMSLEGVRKLKRMNSCSVKIVTLLTEPTEANLSDTQSLTKTMQDDLVVVEEGMKAIAQQQSVEESRQMLLNEMQDLTNYVNKLSDAVAPGQVDTNEAKDAAEKIVDLTTEMYLAQDPSTKSRSQLLNRSKTSFRAVEKMDDNIRRASFLHAAGLALAGTEQAANILTQQCGAAPMPAGARAELSLRRRVGRLSAALALLLTALADPDNIDYATAINSMNTINELLPEIALKGQMLASAKDPEEGEELRELLRALLQRTRALCALGGPDDHTKMQEASNSYADVSSKLIFKIVRGANSQKENELIELAKVAGDKASLLLLSAHELTAQVPPHAAAALDAAGVGSATAAMDLLACARLTAPAIYEAHCRSALTAAAEGLSSSVHQLSATWKPLVEERATHSLGEQLHQREMDVHKAIERLKDAYENLGGMEDESVPLAERQRLRFICSLSGAKDNLKGLTDDWGKGEGGPGAVATRELVAELKETAARRRLTHQLARLNAAVARLAAATSDPQEVDHATAAAALNTIAELMPTISQDADVVSARQDERTRSAMRQYVAGLAEASQHLLDNLTTMDELGPSATKFSAVCSKLVFLISPGADKGKEKMIKELAARAYDANAALGSHAQLFGGGRPARRAERAARHLVTAAQVTAPSIDEESCSSALASAINDLLKCSNEVTASCYPHMKPDSNEYQELQDRQQELADHLHKLAQVCQIDLSGKDVAMAEAPSDKKRLQFINSTSAAKEQLQVAEQLMKEPPACVMMEAAGGAALRLQLGERLARLTAAAAALACAAADRENPNYEAAQKSVETIAELMPEFVKDTCIAGATRSAESQQRQLQQLRQLCDAARALCDRASHNQSLSSDAAKFSDASGKLAFLIGHGAPQHGLTEKVKELSSEACGHAAELVSRCSAAPQRALSRTTGAADALLVTAQMTAPTITSSPCSAVLVSAAEDLRSSARDLTHECQPYVKTGDEDLLGLQHSEQLLENKLDELVKVCKEIPLRKPSAPPQQSKQRAHFANSLSEANNCFDDLQQYLNRPVVCALMREEDGWALRLRLAERLGQLGAAVAALGAAVADRERPDYASAQRAVRAITALMPQLVRDSKTVCGTKDGDDQQNMLEQVQQLCDASKAVCDSTQQPEALREAAAKFSVASNKLLFTLSPAADQRRDLQIMQLARECQSHASELEALLGRLPADVVARLESRAARSADAAQGLLAAAQETALRGRSPHHLAALESALIRLQESASDLNSVCDPHLEPAFQRQHVLETQRNLEDCLDVLSRAIHDHNADDRLPVEMSPEQKEKQRLQFTITLSGAKRSFDDVQQQLKQPLVPATLPSEEQRALQLRLSARLAELNAAVAALAAAAADREHPDYASAQQAVNTIATLMPELVQDAKTLSCTKQGPVQQAMLDHLRHLIDASRDICEDSQQPEGLSKAALKFSEATSKLSSDVTHVPGQGRQRQVVEMTAASGRLVSELLGQVQALTQQAEGAAATHLDVLGARLADKTQALLVVAQVTAPSISSSQCRLALGSAVEKLRGSAADLKDACDPHMKQVPQRHQFLDTHQQLDDSLNMLLQASGARLSPKQQEKQRLQFTSSLSDAKKCFDDVQQQLKQPLVPATLPPEEQSALRLRLSDKLAQLNAAVAALAASTHDHEHPDYATAQRAVNTITALIPELIRDTKALSGTKQGLAQQTMLQQVQHLCDACRAVCDSSLQPQDLNEAATQYSKSFGQLMASIDPTSDPGTETWKLKELSEASDGCASELVTRVLRAGGEEQRGPAARTAGAARALRAAALVTSPSTDSPQCQETLKSAVSTLRENASELVEACDPHLKPGAQRQQVQDAHRQLDDSLQALLQASDPEAVRAPVEQETPRAKFIRSVSSASSQLDHAGELLQEPPVCVGVTMSAADSEKLRARLARRLALLNAAVAALSAASADYKYPDYAAAERSIITITELMPKVLQESKAMTCNKSEEIQKKIHENLKELYDTSRSICDNAHDIKQMNESAAKFAFASGKLVALVATDDEDLQNRKALKQKQKPAVPLRSARAPVAAAVPSRHSGGTQDFLDSMRAVEDENAVRMAAAEEQARRRQQFASVVDTADSEASYLEDMLQHLQNSRSNHSITALDAARRERLAEEALARVAAHAAALVAANRESQLSHSSDADKFDYDAAEQSTLELVRALRIIVEDGSAISCALPEKSREPFRAELRELCGAARALCGAARALCGAARGGGEKLNDAAIALGKRCARLAQVVSAHVDVPLENEVTSRASTIGSCASRLAQEATNLTSNSINLANNHANTDANLSPEIDQSQVHSICAAGVQCLDAATKFVVTAKLMAPTIHHKICQDTLTSSAKNLSTNLTAFSDTWKPLATDIDAQKLTEESCNLVELLNNLKDDVESGKLGKRSDLDREVVVDTPLRQMTAQIIDNARNMAEHGELPPETKQEYKNYCSRLTDALRQLDFANVRCQRAPHDPQRRHEMDAAAQELHRALLQSRPARTLRDPSNIVDFRDFLQGLVKESDNLSRAADRSQAAIGKRVADDIKILCSKISEDSAKLMNPAEGAGYGDDSFDDIVGIEEFGQECEVLVTELNSMVQSVPEQKARRALLTHMLLLTEQCSLLRFATSAALSTAETAAFDAALQDLDDFPSTVIKAIANHRPQSQKMAPAFGVRRARRCLMAAAHRPVALRRALATYAVLAAPDFRTQYGCKSNATETILKLGISFGEVTDISTHRPDTSDPVRCNRAIKDKPSAPMKTEEEIETQLLSQIQKDTGYNSQFEKTDESFIKHLEQLTKTVQQSTQANSLLVANWMKPDRAASTHLIKKAINDIQVPNAVNSRLQFAVLKEEDIDNLFSVQTHEVKGNRNEVEGEFQQLCSELSSTSASVLQSFKHPSAAARSLRAARALAGAARQLARAERPVQASRIEDAAHEMCLATYGLLEVSEHLCQNPDHHDARARLLEACYHLNDSINKLNRCVEAGAAASVSRECGELLRLLQLRRSALLAAAAPPSASPYAHCVDALHDQRDVLLKLNSEEAMSREEFLKSMLYVTTAVINSTECAAQANYLLSVSEKDKTVALEGLVDVAKMQKLITYIQDTCVNVILSPEDQVIEEKKVLQKQIDELLTDIDMAIEKIKDQDLKTTLRECHKDVAMSTKAFYAAVDKKMPAEKITSLVLSVNDSLQQLSGALEEPGLVPKAGQLSRDTQVLCDDVMQHSTALISDTQDLIQQIKASPKHSDAMRWSSFSKTKEVLNAFDALLKSIKTCGQNINILEADIEECEQKSYVKALTETAFKWLHKPMTKSDVKANGQQAVRNLINVGDKMSEELSGADKEDLRHLVEETEQLFTHCSRKYDQDQYSLLMERIRELRKALERMAVTRLVEDFMEAAEPLADLDILADAQKDEKSRKFLLERKIAELLAQLGRVQKTASFVADTGSAGPKVSAELRACTEQTELLAPMLVKAAEERIHKSDDKAVIDNYKALLAKYTESLSKIRDLCDQSVDPMDFVQTAGETMQRMREDSINQDPMKCAYTSAAITKLAGRVIQVGLWSRGARGDPELQRCLADAQRQLSAATPAPDSRASNMPDFKDTTAQILHATDQVESALGGENIFKHQPASTTSDPIYNGALNLHVAIRDWSSRDNEIVAVARRMAVLMAKLSAHMHADKQREVLTTSKAIVSESAEVARLARKLALECCDRRIRTNLLQVCERIPTISGQLKMLTTVKGSALGHHGSQEDKEALDMLVGNAQSLMTSIQDVVKAAASASVKILSQRGPKIRWVRKTYY